MENRERNDVEKDNFFWTIWERHPNVPVIISVIALVASFVVPLLKK